MADHPMLEKVERLRLLLTSIATGDGWDATEYSHLRKEILNHPDTKDIAPRFLSICRQPGDFWEFIKEQSPTWKGRRTFLRQAFMPLLTRLEGMMGSPVEQPIAEILSRIRSENVLLIWRKALERRKSDPEGAITAARTLLESVCKHILDESDIEYGESPDVTELYRLTAGKLNLAPSQHTEQVFKKILGSCQAVVDGLANMRNRLGDAHGKGAKAAKPAPRHAELAVNLAGTMASFLIATWEARKRGGS